MHRRSSKGLKCLSRESIKLGMEDLKSTTHFVLHLFQEEHFIKHLHIHGSLVRSATSLQVSYELSGNVDDVLLPPPPSSSPRRKDGLWQATCFEFFVAATGSPQYWEINLSPSGDWNVYAFTEYRHGMHEEAALAALPCTVHRQLESYRLALDFPLAQLIAPDQPIEVAISAVLLGDNGQRGFYALTHCGSQPDFHQRESFLLRL